MEASAPKRPFYLFVALVVAWLFGVGGCTQGAYIIGSYWSPTPDVQQIASRATTEEARTALAQATTRCFEASDAAKSRVYPLGAASLVLGVAILMFAARALGGRATARAFLVQLLIAQGAFALFADTQTKDVAAACLDLQRQLLRIDLEAKKNDPALVDKLTPALRDKAAAGAAAARTAAAALVVLALLRRRTREYFEAVERFRAAQVGP